MTSTSADKAGAERSEVIAYLRSRLIGPERGPTEELPDRPSERYLMGTLYPQNLEAGQVFAEEDEDSVAAGDSEEDAEQPISMVFQRMPSSMGVSFYVEGEPTLKCHVSAARYTESKREKPNSKPGSRKVWVRSAIAERDRPESHVVDKPGDRKDLSVSVLDGHARLHVVWRSLDKGWLITVALCNVETTDDHHCDASLCLFQCALTCSATAGEICEYPSSGGYTRDDEEEELALIYRSSVPYAIGHGCAATWTTDDDNRIVQVNAEFLPTTEVFPVTTALPDEAKLGNRVVSIRHLASDDVGIGELEKELRRFSLAYTSWIAKLESEECDGRYESARRRVLERLRDAARRMDRGIDLLVDKPLALRAFRLANRAMLMQMVHGGKEFGGTARERNSSPFSEPDYSGDLTAGYMWRPFQLAFQLLALSSVWNGEDAERDIVDLIWFPTGGGKTEAYLALAAFEMIRRRLVDRNGGGTAVIKRYTLRLLTSQQFQRAATLICALERLRVTLGDELGSEPFTLGLWVGGTSSPNRYTAAGEFDKGAVELREEMLDEEEPENKFQLQQCPWCGTRIVPKQIDEDASAYGVDATETSFRLFCPSDGCPFHQRLPVSVVDEHLYQFPPTMLIGTIDKFARLAWDHRASAFFGNGGRVDPPSLIIQDEMHLISGPLGSIAGIYEAAIDTLIRRLGRRPKILAATATIRRADEQVERLYARPVEVFPPAGVDFNDSFYARTDFSAPGRLFVGVMGQGHTPMTSLVHTAAALFHGVRDVDLSEASQDTWGTLVIYHNSRRELGKTMTLARDDIPARAEIIAIDQSKLIKDPNVEELSANVKGTRIPEVLQLLETPVRGSSGVHVLACTNMISVGVDVSRLGMMLMNGQPKTTSEYIQATSRVGRDQNRPPGIVVTLYSATKPRDRSHYEGFSGYHSALYRAVEPTSVTPYAPPARSRAMHAALVIMMRLAGGLPSNADAARFDAGDVDVRSLVDAVVDRMVRADRTEATMIRAEMEQLINQWTQRIEDAQHDGRPLRYESKGGNQFASLLCGFNDRRADAWPTLNSMRNVDVECKIGVQGEPNE